MWPLLAVAAVAAAKKKSAKKKSAAKKGGQAVKKKTAAASGTSSKRWRWPLPNLPDGRKPVISSGFGKRKNGKMHYGADITYPAQAGDPKYPGHYTADRSPKHYSPANRPVLAVAAGLVTLTSPVTKEPIRGQVYILHDDGTMTRYAHLARVDVAAGDEVAEGDILGIMGAGAGTPFRHVHFEWFNKRLKLGGKAQDPAKKLAAATVTVDKRRNA